jgi:hypothetical protein
LLNSIPIPEVSLPELALAAASVVEPVVVSPAVAAPMVTVDETSMDPRMLHAAAAVGAGTQAAAAPLSIYLTDQELMRQQPAVHEGEVDP